MPGILPMKVIKVGNSSQSRIAQACDRCRSKKIRCDGIRPTCSQCANVGFECKTSDKLSRRAFPRGYTESLEERVRQLENEVRELKDLLDEKDEKLDMLSRMDANRYRHTPATSPSTSDSHDSRRDVQVIKEDTFRVQPTPLLLGVENSDSYFMGPSSGRSFIGAYNYSFPPRIISHDHRQVANSQPTEAFKRKVQETGRPCEFSPDAFLHIQGCRPLTTETPAQPLRPPPRMFSDRCVNVYFQEWAPLFPILHKPTFLRVYEEFVADPEKVKSNHKLAQLYLVFSIAGLGFDSPDFEQLAVCELQWKRALDAVLSEDTVNTLQCLILALLFCTVRADYKRLQHYKGVAVSLSHRLGLHQSQKRFSFGALTIETRKKVFWTLYTLDCFTAAVLGLPKLLREDDVQAEYPADTDDEYVTEKGFQPTLPGECTRLSSALALFRAARIMAQVLEKLYPAAAPYELSLQQMSALTEDLDGWYETLPSHLKLNFAQDKPSTDVTGSRSPLLALAYYSIRMLIHRPAVGSSLGPKAAPALLSLVESSKHIVQIVQLLEERNMTFSMCFNKGDLLVICGMSLLYHTVDLKSDSKLIRDNERQINAVAKLLHKTKASGETEFRRIASMLVSLEGVVETTPVPKSKTTSMAAPARRLSPTSPSKPRSSLAVGSHPAATVSETDLLQQQQKLRRMTMPSQLGQRPRVHRSTSRQSFENGPTELTRNYQNQDLRASYHANAESPTSQSRPRHEHLSARNDVGLSQSPSPVHAYMQPTSMLPQQGQSLAGDLAMVKSLRGSSLEWEALLGAMDGGVNNVYDAIYGGGTTFVQDATTTGETTNSDWSPDTFDLSTFNIGDFDTEGRPSVSVHSTSEDGLSSGEEGLLSSIGRPEDYHNQLLAFNANGKSYIPEGLEAFPY
ncbi:hypothetical protein S40293_08697 [Stachybotrys chartarum IBT 40293]|nr:hypothetical protein S40293_08697 [Stachybotrys chartarum IBT 40293]